MHCVLHTVQCMYSIAQTQKIQISEALQYHLAQFVIHNAHIISHKLTRYKYIMLCNNGLHMCNMICPQKCLPQSCLLVGNSEVGMIKLNHHQKCLPQLYYYIFKCECLAALTGDEVVVENYFNILTTSYQPAVSIERDQGFRQDVSWIEC